MNRKTFNQTIIIRAVIAGLLICVGAQGSAVAQGKNYKYAVVDMQQVILNVAEGKAARSGLEKEIKAKEADLMSKKKGLDKMNKEWKAQAPLLSESARFKRQQEFQEKFLSLRNQEMAFQQQIKAKEAKATQKIAIAITKLVNGIAKERGYEMVFETSSAGLVYLKDPYDLTREVIAAFDARTKKKKGNTAKK
jgi:outer membrane protein